MTTNTVPSTIIPDVPRQSPMVDENGHMTEIWRFFFDQLVLALQVNFKTEGIAVPQLPTSSINNLTRTTPINGNGISSVANIIYDSTTNEFKGNIAGTWKVFTLT